MKNKDNLLKALEVLQTVASLDMVIVPIEPTEKMIDSGFKIEPNLTKEKIKNIYAAMLLAHDEDILV